MWILVTYGIKSCEVLSAAGAWVLERPRQDSWGETLRAYVKARDGDAESPPPGAVLRAPLMEHHFGGPSAAEAEAEANAAL